MCLFKKFVLQICHGEQRLWSAWSHLVGCNGFRCWQHFTVGRRIIKTSIKLFKPLHFSAAPHAPVWSAPNFYICLLQHGLNSLPPFVSYTFFPAVCLLLSATFRQLATWVTNRSSVFHPIWWKYDCLEHTETTDRAEKWIILQEWFKKFVLMLWCFFHSRRLSALESSVSNMTWSSPQQSWSNFSGWFERSITLKAALISIFILMSDI